MNDDSVFGNGLDPVPLSGHRPSAPHDNPESSGATNIAAHPRSDYDWDRRVISMVATSWRPFEVTFMLAATACGIAMLTFAARMAPITDVMPVLTQTIWKASLVPVGILGLVGITWRGQLSTGMAMRLGSLILLGTATGMYTIAILTELGIAAMPSAAFVSAVPVAAWWRSGQITMDLVGLARAAERQPPSSSR
ncbi:hypothetical protein OG792_23430 [Micromonospora sp. NBC_01699]|uniref:hypothetical protein n=1 Tax=Micromonospora sp. NBC_01699 TaxID=2975984 RepID=UPI002E27DB45|nr:hypothetical protein [Micromonospora sp. NBC_01699]